MGLARYVVCMRELKNVNKILDGKPEGKRSPVRPGHRWKDNIKIDLLEMFTVCVDWFCLAQDRDCW
jgi:hypothetical protein